MIVDVSAMPMEVTDLLPGQQNSDGGFKLKELDISKSRCPKRP